MAQPRATHTDSRLPQMLDAAARLLCRQGYEGTSVLDIARAVRHVLCEPPDVEIVSMVVRPKGEG